MTHDTQREDCDGCPSKSEWSELEEEKYWVKVMVGVENSTCPLQYEKEKEKKRKKLFYLPAAIRSKKKEEKVILPARCNTSSATQKSLSTPSTAIIFQLEANGSACSR